MILENTFKTAQVDNIHLEYSEHGQGQPVLLLHGLLGNLSNWSDTITYFARDYRVIAPRLPIYDISFRKDVLHGLADYVHALVKHLRLQDIVLVGNSLGGHLAILYTLAHPDRVKHLVLTGSSGLFESNLGVSYPKRGNFDYISEKVRYTFYNQNVVSSQLIDDVYAAVNDLRKSIGILKAAKAANRHHVGKDLGKITTPTLLIWGKQDKVTPVRVAYQFLEALGGKIELHIIDHCGHAPMMEQPDEFNRILSQYLIRTNEETSAENQDQRQIA